ncbi:MAG TPA: hypothetical protein VGK40_03745, partial [Verrucomicrobiae bacterium]
MKFECPQCAQRLAAEPEMAGREITCPACASVIIIPTADAGSTSHPPGGTEVALLAQSDAPPSMDIPAVPVGETPTGAGETPALPTTGRRFPIKPLVMAAAVSLLAGGGWFLLKGKTSGTGLLSIVGGPPPAEVKVFPPEINLATRGDRQSIVVQAIYADGLTRDVTVGASFSFADKSFARLEKDTLIPVADGKTELTVKYAGKSV